MHTEWKQVKNNIYSVKFMDLITTMKISNYKLAFEFLKPAMV